MALEGTVKTPFGQMSKKTVAIGGIGVAGVIGIVWYRSKQQSAAAAASTATTATTGATVTDPDGNVCSALNPATGYCPGTPGDLAAQGQSSQGFADQLGSGGYYDPNGNWIPYSQQSFPSPTPGPGSFTSNPQWVQYVEDYLINTSGMSSADVGAAIGKYIAGLPVTSDQVSIITQAIAVGGQPPTAGNGGYPPNYHEQAAGPPPTGGTVTVPNVVGQSIDNAHLTLASAGLTFNTHIPIVGPHGITRKVTKQNPAAGQKVKPKTYVSLTYVDSK